MSLDGGSWGVLGGVIRRVTVFMSLTTCDARTTGKCGIPPTCMSVARILESWRCSVQDSPVERLLWRKTDKGTPVCGTLRGATHTANRDPPLKWTGSATRIVGVQAGFRV